MRVGERRPTLHRLRPPARRGARCPFRGPQLRRLLLVSRAWSSTCRRCSRSRRLARPPRGRGRQRGGRSHLDRRLQPAGRAGPAPAGRLVPDRRHRGPGPGGRDRRLRPGLRVDVRPVGQRRDRHGGRQPCGGADRDRTRISTGPAGAAAAGTSAIVTSFGFTVHPIPEAITLFTLEWPWGAAASVLDAWLAMDALDARPAVGQLPTVQRRHGRERAGQGHRRLRRKRGRLLRRAGPADGRGRGGHDVPLRRARGVPDGDHDRGGLRGQARGPVRRAGRVAVQGQVVLRRRATPRSRP